MTVAKVEQLSFQDILFAWTESKLQGQWKRKVVLKTTNKTMLMLLLMMMWKKKQAASERKRKRKKVESDARIYWTHKYPLDTNILDTKSSSLVVEGVELHANAYAKRKRERETH